MIRHKNRIYNRIGKNYATPLLNSTGARPLFINTLKIVEKLRGEVRRYQEICSFYIPK